MRAADLVLRSLTARRLSLWAGLGAAALALTSLSTFAKDHALMINASRSLPCWAIWLTRGALPERGEIIVFDPPASPLLERHFGKKPKPFGKKVSGVPGDVVTEKDRSFFINGRKVAMAKRASRLGEPLALGPTGIVPAGCYFVTTAHKDGFDSRYAAIGWICARRILGVGRPIL
ncbi:S26 family signal peptidase [Novosphingobium album (ex Liu et al. 2023)]|uniref:S26 family signal peptidase n=1 Tax=Novosphingobium album (ex Liu et al. 2023) TaxID=3031130 RepID=A0ABT5WQW8_9SPHN|nr:S26 family signal peptidase [Novosphingobium album (ex Liu et al. 2023)]MDE8652244.1 S26 family signal peptidase [Novosphingobium album (ex Liu et al. 2023)]